MDKEEFTRRIKQLADGPYDAEEAAGNLWSAIEDEFRTQWENGYREAKRRFYENSPTGT